MRIIVIMSFILALLWLPIVHAKWSDDVSIHNISVDVPIEVTYTQNNVVDFQSGVINTEDDELIEKEEKDSQELISGSEEALLENFDEIVKPNREVSHQEDDTNSEIIKEDDNEEGIISVIETVEEIKNEEDTNIVTKVEAETDDIVIIKKPSEVKDASSQAGEDNEEQSGVD